MTEHTVAPDSGSPAGGAPLPKARLSMPTRERGVTKGHAVRGAPPPGFQWVWSWPACKACGDEAEPQFVRSTGWITPVWDLEPITEETTPT